MHSLNPQSRILYAAARSVSGTGREHVLVFEFTGTTRTDRRSMVSQNRLDTNNKDTTNSSSNNRYRYSGNHEDLEDHLYRVLGHCRFGGGSWQRRE
jgi:hypothetical protein